MPRIILHALLLVLGFFGAAAAMGDAPVIGFRTDGTGRYPSATPPREWGPDKNVVWHLKLTQSNAIPVILGDRLFTCAEPCVLLCFNKADGKPLWKHESFFKEIEPTAAEKEQIEFEGKKESVLTVNVSARLRCGRIRLVMAARPGSLRGMAVLPVQRR